MLLPYHLRLAVRSLRRDPGLSAIVVVVLALGGGIFCTAVMTYLRMYWNDPALADSLHQVEIPVEHDALHAALDNTNAEPNVVASRERMSFPRYRVLAGSNLPVRQTGTFRARVLVGAGPPRNARFASADFFALFPQDFRYGGPWTHDEEKAGAPRVVLGLHVNAQLFGGRDSVGRTVMVDDRPFVVAGVLARDQPFSPAWDRAMTGGTQDQLYLPWGEHERLMARPEAPVTVAPTGPGYADLLASDTVATTFWIDLPTPALRAAYARYLAEALHGPYVLRDLPRIRRELAFPRSVMSFFLFLTFLALVGAGMVAMRLLLAKSLVRQGELSIFRAVGAPRGALVVRQLLEAALLSLAGGVCALAVAAPAAFVYNRLVADTDVPLAVTPASMAVTVVATALVGTLAALYPAWRSASRRPTAALMRS